LVKVTKPATHCPPGPTPPLWSPAWPSPPPPPCPSYVRPAATPSPSSASP